MLGSSTARSSPGGYTVDRSFAFGLGSHPTSPFLRGRASSVKPGRGFHRSDAAQRVLGVISIDMQTTGAYAELERATQSARGPELDLVLRTCEDALSR